MENLNWLQRLFLKKVTGKVTDVEYMEWVILPAPVTLYTISQQDGTLCRGALRGYHFSPQIGDKVEMHLKKNRFASLTDVPVQRRRQDGSLEVMIQDIVWGEIKGYRILKGTA